MIGTAAWLAGAVGATAVVAALVWGATGLRRVLVPAWAGAPARLVEALLVLAVPVGVAELLGAVGELSRWPVAVASTAGGLAMGLLARRRAAAVPPPDEAGPVAPAREPVVEVAAATGAAAVVVAQWISHVVVALDRGPTHTDTLWYHLPYAARFVQRGRLTGLIDRADALHTYAVHNAELVQALAMLPFGRDLLAPLVNLGWLALAVLAAWCIGRTRDRGSLSVLAVVVVLGLPPLAGTHPGQGSNDVAAAALVLTAVALLLHGRLAPAPTVLAAVAAGLAAATKLTVLAPVAVLTLGVVVLTVRRQRLVAAAWVFALALFGCFWFLRNLAVADSPLPWFDVELGPLRLRASALQGRGDTFVDYLFDSTVWRDRYLPGFRQALSATWPLVLLVGIGGAAVALVRRGDPLVRLAGAMVLTGAVSYAFTPLTADAGGLAFVFNLRYLTPTLLLGFALVPLWLPAGARWGRGAAVALLVQVAVNAFLHHYERVEAWPTEGLVWGVLAGAGVVGAVAWHRAGSPRARLVRPVAVGLAAVLVLAGGAVVQRRYLERRYVDAGLPLDAIDVAFRDVSDRRVAIAGSLNIYPLFGLDLSNEVERVDVLPGPSGQERCRRWKEEVNQGSFDYLVAGAESFFAGTGAPPETWVDATVATEVASGGGGVAYRLSGPLDPNSCPPDSATPTPPAPAPGG